MIELFRSRTSLTFASHQFMFAQNLMQEMSLTWEERLRATEKIVAEHQKVRTGLSLDGEAFASNRPIYDMSDFYEIQGHTTLTNVPYRSFLSPSLPISAS